MRHRPNGMLNIIDAAEGIAGGMSGSPIIAEDGTAIGIVGTSGGPHGVPHTEGGPNPRLMGNLPGWFLTILAKTKKPKPRAKPKRTRRIRHKMKRVMKKFKP